MTASNIRGKLALSGDLELAVAVSQMDLNGLRRHVQRLGDSAIAEALGGER